MEQLLINIIVALIGLAGVLLVALIHSRGNEKRLRRELDSREKQHLFELRARAMDYLMKPRVDGHMAVLQSLWILRSAATRFSKSDYKEGEENFKEARNCSTRHWY